jgi:hypothetical protein
MTSELRPSVTPSGKPKLLDRVRHAIRVRPMARSTERLYVNWIRRFILFHHKRHPEEMGKVEVSAFRATQPWQAVGWPRADQYHSHRNHQPLANAPTLRITKPPAPAHRNPVSIPHRPHSDGRRIPVGRHSRVAGFVSLRTGQSSTGSTRSALVRSGPPYVGNPG